METQAQLQREERISKLLEPGEQVLWRGQPDLRSFIAYPTRRVIVSTLILILLAKLEWKYLASGDWFMGVVLFAVLLSIFIGPLIERRGLRRRWYATEYLVTDKKLLSLDPTWLGGKFSFPLEDITSSRLASIRKDRVGTLVFKSRYYNGKLEFSGVKESQTLLELVRQAQKKRLAELGQSA
jgi:hypothetical protein